MNIEDVFLLPARWLASLCKNAGLTHAHPLFRSSKTNNQCDLKTRPKTVKGEIRVLWCLEVENRGIG
jgi:hypothetical protein